jgi:DNA replication protein DnaC
MAMYANVRRMRLRDGLSISEIARRALRAQLAHLDLVILDELGYLPFSSRAARCSFTCCPSCTNTPA